MGTQLWNDEIEKFIHETIKEGTEVKINLIHREID